jgi:hypothetical protein
MQGENEKYKYTSFYSKCVNGIILLEDMGMDVRIILKCVLSPS